MTSRLTCLLIFTLLLGLPTAAANGSSSTTATDPPTAAPPTTAVPTPAPTVTPPPTLTCPDDKAFNSYCGKINNQQCKNFNEICYRDMKDSSTSGSTSITACCVQSENFCPATGLYTKHHEGNGGWLYQYLGEAELPKDLWYKREHINSGNKGVACPLPNSYTLKVPGEKYLPIGWENNKPKKCKMNSECDSGQFCDAVWNPSFEKGTVPFLDESLGGKSIRFCYKHPKLPENMKHVPHDNGLKLCSSHYDCNSMDEICHEEKDKITYYNETSGKKVSGICVHVDSCPKGMKRERAVLNTNSQPCHENIGCQGAGVSKGRFDYNPHCLSYFPPDPTRKLCCFEENPKCRLGKAETPIKNCTQMSDCTGDVLVKDATWNLWCDDDGKNVCCKDMENKLWQCPDLVTPLFNEPKCTGYSKDNIHSGTCPKKGGRCVHGHCCPPLSISENGTKVDLGKNLYETEFPCNPANPIQPGFSYAFCNADTKKLIIVGKYHNNGDSMTKVSGSKCTINADCSPDGSSVCVYENDKNHVCYYNPLRALRPEVSSFWKTVLIISLVCAGVFMIISLVCFVCYRSKSVFDKYKKKGKKGSKGSDSKSSKGGKNKKKGGKKGGKKGKKGEESSKSSKSKKSKSKKSKKDTEKSKSEATTGDGGSTSSQLN
ncbi:hypothetical protein B9Z55_002497 [Caenorhabditis nigoni]|nr:hypothetical protein B9Z55_002497 [Caenorhabditis nigoni]